MQLLLTPGLAAALLATQLVQLGRPIDVAGTAGVQFASIRSVDLDADGNLIVADAGNHRIYRFTAAGRLIDSVGRRGRGPGEFQALAGVAAGPGGRFATVDILQRRLVLWDRSGHPATTVTLTTGGAPTDVAWTGAAPVVKMVDFRDTLRWIEIGPDGGPGVERARAVETPPAVSCVLCRSALTSSGGVLVTGPDTAWRVSEISGTGISRRFDRPPVGAAPRTEAEIDELVERMARGPAGARGSPERPSAPDRSRFRFHPRHLGIGVDAGGRVWVLARHAGFPRPVLDVFGPDGRYHGTTVPEVTLEGLTVRGRRIAARGLTADGEPTVYLFDLGSPPPRGRD